MPGAIPNLILIYNPSNIAAARRSAPPTGAGALDGPQQIASDTSGAIYVTSFGTANGVARTQEYSAAGACVRTITTVTGGGAEGVAIDLTTNALYASFLGNSESHGALFCVPAFNDPQPAAS